MEVRDIGARLPRLIVITSGAAGAPRTANLAAPVSN
jgi:hypothetical protein